MTLLCRVESAAILCEQAQGAETGLGEVGGEADPGWTELKKTAREHAGYGRRYLGLPSLWTAAPGAQLEVVRKRRWLPEADIERAPKQSTLGKVTSPH